MSTLSDLRIVDEDIEAYFTTFFGGLEWRMWATSEVDLMLKFQDLRNQKKIIDILLSEKKNKQ
jgi:hypothetical protein